MAVKAVESLVWLIKVITMLLMPQTDQLERCKIKAIQRDQIPKFIEVVELMVTQIFQRVRMEQTEILDRMQCK